MSTNRRNFLKKAALGAASAAGTAAAATAAGALVATPASAQPGARRGPRELDAPTLAALGHAILPESLGASGRERAIAAFAAWIGDYRPVSEEMHGYGDAEITYTPADPAPGWNAQLQALDLLAHRKHKRAFAALDVPARRALVRAQLARTRGNQLPGNPLNAPHVAIALLAHWAGSSEATDLAYGVRIARGNCRPLADSPRKPLPLAAPEKR